MQPYEPFGFYLTGMHKVWVKHAMLWPELLEQGTGILKPNLVLTCIKIIVMLNNRNKQFAVLVLLFIVAPGIHFFVSGENHLVPEFRAYLVGVQIALGTGLALWFWRRENPGK